MRTFRISAFALTATGALLGGLPMCTHGAPPPSRETAAPVSSASLPAAAPPAITSRDAQGASRFLWAAAAHDAARVAMAAEPAARAYLARHAAALGTTEAAVRRAHVQGTHAIPGGAQIVTFGERVGGVEVFHSRASVILDEGRRLVAISGSLKGAGAVRAGRFVQTAEDALARAYTDRYGVSLPSGAIADLGPEGEDYRALRLTAPRSAPRLVESARVKKVLFPEAGRLLPAYYAELIARAPGETEDDGWAYVVAADDGRVLSKRSITAHEAFKYRVWASPDGHHIPNDGPMVDYSPHPTGKPDKVRPGFVAPTLVSMEGFNTNPAGGSDPWLAPTATETKGNNVDAYTDRDQLPDGGNDGYTPGDDYRADLTSPLTFDRTFDVTKNPDATVDQQKAAVTQLFYVTNWLHDYWYDSGFDEKAGNAQAQNYGRGGVEGDVLHAEAQDSANAGQANNANMSTPADGRSPRMQMYVWSGEPNRAITTTPPLALADGINAATFGPQTFELTAAAVLADDQDTTGANGTAGTTSDACQALKNDVKGKIVVSERGLCSSAVKVTNAQAAGAAGLLLVHNVAGHAPVNPGGTPTGITIPLLTLSYEDGQLVKNALAGGLSVTLKRGPEVIRDGTIDNTVVAHEWGHYLHQRLVQCGSQSCGGMSEGWGDFDALMLVVREGDALDGTTFALSQYATVGLNTNNEYFGIRRAPYSTDMAKNPFTFGHIRKASKVPTTAPIAASGGDMSEVHNVGEIWAETLFEAYVNLLGDTHGASPRLTFDQAKRRMADYVVAGMKGAPPDPTFTEQRDAILAAAWARDKADFAALSKGFAKRGLGVAAVAPPASSEDLNEAVENFDTGANVGYVDAKVDDSVRSCDQDGALDANEDGVLTVRVRNGGWLPLTKTKVTVTTSTPGITLAAGGKADVSPLDPFGVATVKIGIHADGTIKAKGYLPISITIADPESVTKTVDATIDPLFNYDEVPASSAKEDVESASPPWTFAHPTDPEIEPAAVWARVPTDADPHAHLFHGADLGSPTDESLVSPDLVISNAAPFTIAWKHRFSFENGPATAGGPTVYFDGGVVEISVAGGPWEDISTYADPGYTQSIFHDPNGDTNVLAGRKAFAAESAGYPAMADAALDLGTKLAGKTVKIRFRIGTDGGTSAAGWDIDDLAFGGLTNTPFTTVVDDRAACSSAGDDAGTDAGSDAGPTPPPPAPDGGTPTGDGGHDDGCAAAPGGPSTSRAWPLALLAGLTLLITKRRRR